MSYVEEWVLATEKGRGDRKGHCCRLECSSFSFIINVPIVSRQLRRDVVVVVV